MVDKSRVEPIQALRGVAAGLVVLHHAFEMAKEQAGPHSSRLFELFNNPVFGASGVDLFFVISGFVMMTSLNRAPEQRPGAFLWRRFLRIVPLYWLMSLLYLGLRSSVDTVPTFHALANTAFVLPVLEVGYHYDTPVLAVGWTLAFEFIFYAIVAAALALPKASRALFIIAMLIAFAGLGLIWQPRIIVAAMAINPILFEFLLGVCVSRLVRLPLSRAGTLAILAIGGGTLAWNVLGGPPFSMDPWLTIGGRTSLLRVLVWGAPWAMIALALAKLPGKPGILTRLGDASYSIYLSHMFVMTGILALWKLHPGVAADVIILASVPLGIAAGLPVFRWIEQPLVRLLSARRSAAIGILAAGRIAIA